MYVAEAPIGLPRHSTETAVVLMIMLNIMTAADKGRVKLFGLRDMCAAFARLITTYCYGVLRPPLL